MIASIAEYVQYVESITPIGGNLWYRGEPESATPLLPRLWREHAHIENTLLQLFRMKAPMFSHGPYPPREAIDQWLFLAQHMRLPTRLLDWTESALAGLYFALLHDRPVVWILDPLRLNELADPGHRRHFPLSWDDADNPMAVNNIRSAWTYDANNLLGVDLPVAVHPTNIHPRMMVQHSCFTVHGNDHRSLVEQTQGLPGEPALVARIEIDKEQRPYLTRLLRVLGISTQTMFPDLEGLARELSDTA